MSRPSSTTVPPPEEKGIPGGRVMLGISVVVFLACMAAGLFRSWTVYHGFPRVGVEYVTDLNAMVSQQGYAAAYPHIRTAAHIEFDNEAAVTRLLQTAREMGDADSVLWAHFALVRLKPADGQVRNELVSELLNQRRVVEALAHGEFAVRLNPDSALAYSNLGAALMGLDEKPAAASAYRRALELDPNSEAARRALEFPLRGF